MKQWILTNKSGRQPKLSPGAEIHRKSRNYNITTMKPVGYYGVDVNNPLIIDMCETWGQDLSKLNYASKMWLVYHLTSILLNDYYEEKDLDPDCQEVLDRIGEIKISDLEALVQALAS